MTSCSLEALAVGEPLPGTAPLASVWIVIEQPGPWGRDVLADSPLDPRVAAHLSAAKRWGISVLLARHPDRPGRDLDAERHVWVARSVAGGHLLRHGLLADLDDLLSWDLAAMGAGHLPAMGTIDPTPTTFVCTHSKRDRCCAVSGRALITDLLVGADAAQRARIWECSHIGGHRFAPVMLTLPSGAVHGRLDLDSAREVIQRAVSHEVVLDRLRGLSGFTPPFQVAAIEVMGTEQVARDDQLDVLRVIDGRAVPVKPGHAPDDGSDCVEAEVRHVDGRAWRATMKPLPLEAPRIESCDKEPVTGVTWECVSLLSVAPWS